MMLLRGQCGLKTTTSAPYLSAPAKDNTFYKQFTPAQHPVHHRER